MNDLFHCNLTGKIDRQYLRICAVYRLLMHRKSIDKETAIALLEDRKVKVARATVELWMANPRQRWDWQTKGEVR